MGRAFRIGAGPLLLLAVVGASLTMAAIPSGSDPTWGRTNGPSIPTEEDFARRLALVEEFLPLQAHLRAEFAADFGGMWIDDSGKPHVASVGDAPGLRKAVEDGHWSVLPVIHLVRHSEQELDEILARAHDATVPDPDSGQMVLDGLDISLIAVDIPRNAVIVELLAGSDGQVLRAEDLLGDGVMFEKTARQWGHAACTRTNCPNPMKAGLQLYKNLNGLKACMSGFVMQASGFYWITSAGHCYDSSNNNRYHPSFVNSGGEGALYIGYVQGYTSEEGNIDAMMIRISASQASNKLYVSSLSGVQSVTSRENPQTQEMVGQWVCSSKKSSTSCGTLKNLNVCTIYEVCGQRLAGGMWACGGDSGSPVYIPTGGNTNRAVGLITIFSVSGTCGSQGEDSAYSHIRNVELFFNTSVKTN